MVSTNGGHGSPSCPPPLTSLQGPEGGKSMSCVAICHDSKAASAARQALFQAHAAHNIANIGTSLLTGVLANADGVSAIESDPRLRGSFYCIDTDSFEAARKIMEADPFFTGHAWKQIDYYRWQNPTGAWQMEAARPKGLNVEYGCYLVTSSAALNLSDALMTGTVTSLGSTAPVPEPLASIALVRAAGMEAARTMAPSADWVAALPIAIGRWVHISSLADIEDLRKK